MERSEGVINVVFVCCEEKQRERSQNTRYKTTLSQPRQKRENLGDVFLAVPLTKMTGFTAFSNLMCVCLCAHVCFELITKR